MILTPAERTILTKRLREAEDAQHDLMMGRSVRELVDQSGERLAFTIANADRLRAYITGLKVELGRSNIPGPARVRVL